MTKLRPTVALLNLAGAILACAPPSATAATAQPAPAPAPLDRVQVESIVHAYLMEHPEIIPEALERLEERQMAELISAARSQLETPFAGAWAGNPNGDVVVVEFFDYACGYCRRSAADVERLVAEDSGVKVVYRNFPILGAASLDAARIGLEAARGDKFAGFHRDIFAAAHLDRQVIRQAAQKSSVKLPKDVAAIDAEIGSNIKLARTLGITGTPAFIIGGRFVSGAIGYDALKQAVVAARATKGGVVSAQAPATAK